jgi:hypothetical protein
LNVGNKREYWTPPTLKFFSQVKEEIDTAVKYDKNNRPTRFQGVFPPRYKGIFSPLKDTVGYISKSNPNAALEIA